MSPSQTERAAETFEAHRARLLAIAYRMLGSRAEAEDVVQDAFVRFCDADLAAIESPRAFLATVVTRLCLDRRKSSRAQREVYVGPWLPEPVRTESADPRDAESLSLAFLVLLESLSPLERAVYLLHEVFDYGHGEIAPMIDKEEAAVRQLFHRARAQIVARRPRFAPSRDEHVRLLGAFLQACGSGDLDALRAMLTEDAVARTDGGGRVRAARNVVRGGDAVARFFVGLIRKGGERIGLPREAIYELAEINGAPSVVVRLEGRPIQVIAIETDGTRIHAVDVVLAPDKLAFV